MNESTAVWSTNEQVNVAPAFTSVKANVGLLLLVNVGGF